MALTDLQIRQLRPRDKAYQCTDGLGLYLEVSPSGARLWRYKYRFMKKQKRLSLGSYPDVSLAEARDKRNEARKRLDAGEDPLAERKREKLVAAFAASNTFGDIGREYIEKQIAEGRSPKTIEKSNWLIRQFALIDERPVTELKPLDILAVLKRLEAHGKYETVMRCRSFASCVFRYAVATGRAEEDPTVVLRGALIRPKVTHYAAIIEPDGVGDLLLAIDNYPGNPISRIALQIVPHIMARPGEFRKAHWSEFDLDAAIWKIPAERMKMRRPHQTPLSKQVIVYLKQLMPMTGPKGFVFPAYHTTKRPMSENTVNQALRRIGYARGEVTAHGFRTTASTLLNESGLWSPDAIERSLAHEDANSIRGIYNRGRYWEERVRMHQWWSDYLDELREKAANRLLTRRR
nr:integrase arm-type DNA-binding domain-containing protein [uncultured Cohaesibacter sp.]